MIGPMHFPLLWNEAQGEKILNLSLGKHCSPEKQTLVDKSKDFRLGIIMDSPIVLRKQNGNSGSFAAMLLFGTSR